MRSGRLCRIRRCTWRFSYRDRAPGERPSLSRLRCLCDDSRTVIRKRRRKIQASVPGDQIGGVARDQGRNILWISDRPVFRGEGGIRPSWSPRRWRRSEEHTSELQSLMRISYAVFCLKKKNKVLI